jgi:hypothetical protein
MGLHIKCRLDAIQRQLVRVKLRSIAISYQLCVTVEFCNDVASIYVIFRRQAGALGGQHCGPCVMWRSRGEGINNKGVPGRTHKAYFTTAQASAFAHNVLM